ncbi:TetR/AcrR family transcriptional regulator [Novosphingobium sp. MMS21-SN21R]|uniref:TetR/AcrR family transcriptional regulator n=1 Tax=Novosphingobium sp. MMS21-SN21R TaxID=2969298 RepID=UPI002888719D|nr:TetR/AcrR family transcriptional regulator [Novosphingobium sp. MMS21-SN21R]MDT0510246.1 TetR/AcrR family transcriptional regulator [Novosphingobium sp. MMS21-SN21R]
MTNAGRQAMTVTKIRDANASPAKAATKPKAPGAGSPGKGGGRPRSETTRRAVLVATLELLREGSIQSITIEAIAKQAGVSKATIYRWWQSKASVVIDAFIENHMVHTPMRHDIHPAEALLLHWRLLAEQYSGWPGQIVAQILAEGQSDPSIQREFRERFYYGRRAVVREVIDNLRNRVARLQEIDSEVLMDILYSPVYMRLLWGYGPLDAKFIRDFPRDLFLLFGINFDENDKVIPEG